MDHMDLSRIGFLEVTEERLRRVRLDADWHYCEFLVTPRCNFRCPYCNRLTGPETGVELPLERVLAVIDLLHAGRLRYLHLTGGEPTVRRDLLRIVQYARERGIRVGISTNGSADPQLYLDLVDAGVELFSISLDVDSPALNPVMTGIRRDVFDRVAENIRMLSRRVYVNVGCVITPVNLPRAAEIISFISSLGAHDIKLGTATGFNQLIDIRVPDALLDRHPILAYRIRNFRAGRNMRGLREGDADRCWMVLDDVTIAGEHHYPCAVYAREGGKPIGRVGPGMKAERLRWLGAHEPLRDPICRRFCMDFKCDYNKVFSRLNPHTAAILRAAQSSDAR